MFIAKLPALMGWAFTIVYAILWLLAGYFVFISIPKALKTQSWVEANAHVIENKLIKAQRTHSRTHKQIIVYSAKVRYEYQANNLSYKGITQKLAKREKNGKKIHKAMLEQYPIGATLPIYYNPNDQQQSVTQKGVNGLHLMLGAILFLSISWFSLLILEANKSL